MARRFGDVDFLADGKTYTVRYGNLAWDELKRKLVADTELGCLLAAKKDSAALMLVVREGLAAYHPDLTLEQVIELNDEIAQPGQKNLSQAVWEAAMLSLPELKKMAEGEGRGPKAIPPRPTRRRSTAPR